jgi:GT2 family glycosyltransferase
LEIVIVAATGGRELLRSCLASLERHPLRDGHAVVWVVDNASGDGTLEMVAREAPWARVVALPENKGFGAGNNVALRRARAPWVLLLNPDTEVSEGALDGALAAIRRHAEVAVLGVRLVRRDGSFDHAAKRSFPTPLGAVGHFTGVGRGARASGRLAQYRAPDVTETGEGYVDAVNGAFMLVRRAALDEVGLLDERYHLYGEDLDWCYRFKQAGWRVWYQGNITVLHVKGGTSVVEAGRGRYRGLASNVAFHHAMGRFYRKHYAGKTPLLDGLIYLAIGAKLAGSVARSTAARRSLH